VEHSTDMTVSAAGFAFRPVAGSGIPQDPHRCVRRLLINLDRELTGSVSRAASGPCFACAPMRNEIARALSRRARFVQ
jgi:hypothetical protein